MSISLRLLPILAVVSASMPQAGPAAPSAPPAPPTLMGPGISRALADQRVRQIANVRYALRLDVTGRDTARGHVVIQFDRKERGDVILDFRGPSLGVAHINGQVVSTVENNGAHLRLPDATLRAGLNTVELDFTALIAPSGASIIKYHDTSDNATYLYTLLVPSDANQLFPCFDQPNLKARVTLTLTVPRAWNAVANGVLDSTTHMEQTSTLHFAETKPISTYLIAFAAGPWTQITRTMDGHTITMYVRASRAKEAESDTLIAANARAASWLEHFFDTAFPFPKLDFVLAPAFPFGGMEHPGAIFYNENSFIFRDVPSKAQLIRRQEIIYHEVSHQWFGDMVTMQWFDDLWLKEGFATYMAARIHASLTTPSSEAWKAFYLDNKPLAYAVDGTAGTTSVWQPLDNLDQAKSNYGAIVYNKAPGIIKQLNYLVGDNAFQQGLRQFVRKYAYSNATWRDLLASIGSAAHRSLDGWGQQYILRPGMPVVQQSLSTKNNVTTVTLEQHPAQSLSGAEPWPLKTELFVHYPDGSSATYPVEMTGHMASITLPRTSHVPDFVFANAGDNAYAGIRLDTASAQWLTQHLPVLTDSLLRAMAWNALWDEVRDARLSPAQYLAVVQRDLPHEPDEQIVTVTLGHTRRAVTAYLASAQRETIVPGIETMLQSMLRDASRPLGLRKAIVIALADVTQTSSGFAFLDALLDGTTRDTPPLGQPARWAIVTRLLAANTPDAATRYATETKHDSSSDGPRQAFIAGAARPDAANKHAYFTRYLSDSTLNEEWAMSSVAAFNDVSDETVTFPYLQPALDTLPWIQKNRRIFFLGAWLDAFMNGHTTAAADSVVQTFLSHHPELGLDLRRKVLQTSDELHRTVVIRQKYADG